MGEELQASSRQSAKQPPAVRHGKAKRRNSWSLPLKAILTTVVQPPRTPDALRKNPLGIFVNAINWSKELGS